MLSSFQNNNFGDVDETGDRIVFALPKIFISVVLYFIVPFASLFVFQANPQISKATINGRLLLFFLSVCFHIYSTIWIDAIGSSSLVDSSRNHFEKKIIGSHIRSSHWMFYGYSTLNSIGSIQFGCFLCDFFPVSASLDIWFDLEI